MNGHQFDIHFFHIFLYILLSSTVFVIRVWKLYTAIKHHVFVTFQSKNSYICGVTESHKEAFGSSKVLSYINSNMGWSTMKNLSDRVAALAV